MTKSLTKYFSLTALIILIDQLTKLANAANHHDRRES
jgi:lipoprotein signal peptidase